MAENNRTKYIVLAVIGAIAFAVGTVTVLHQNIFANPTDELIKKSLVCTLLVIGYVAFVVLYDKIYVLPKELYDNRRLIWKLAKNDFKTRYAGSYLGMIWAFVQPIVTILVYWFVFEKGFNAKAEVFANGLSAPYVLWLTAGIVPWFFFSEALTNGTTSLLEYSYLVKKVVFKISILPIIKITAATFIHVFFVVFMLVLYAFHGFYPDLYTLQLIYYSACLYIFILGLSYATCAIIIFFRDLIQIIAIIMQVGMWATPILWRLDIIQPPQYQIIFKLNPVFYIVNGYRSALIEKQWFWEDFYSTMFFWVITAVVFGIGALIFKRLKVHFADVL